MFESEPDSRVPVKSLLKNRENFVHVTNVISPSEFCIVRKTSLEKLNQQVHFLNAENKIDKDQPTEVCIDRMYMARCIKPPYWMRCRVFNIFSTKLEDCSIEDNHQKKEYDTARIYCIDLGEFRNVPFDSLREVPDKLDKVAPLAFQCCLAHCFPRSSGSWSNETITYFRDLIKECPDICVRIVHRYPGRYEVDLYGNINQHPISFRDDLLVNDKCCIGKMRSPNELTPCEWKEE